MLTSADLEALTTEVQIHSRHFAQLREEIGHRIIGQEDFISKLLLGLIAGGHMLIEGVPGLAKTETVKAIAEALDLHFQRIQFTPDLLPADLTGTQIYKADTHSFETRKGPLFANLILADEINRAPAKVQSALLEAMAEKHITIADQTYKLDEPFVVLATQNPLEQEGTYSLPEAQMDRFLMKLKISYPSRDEEKRIMNLMSIKKELPIQKIMTPEVIFKARELVDKIYVDDKVQDYIIDIVFATRYAESRLFGKVRKINELEGMISCGASPRASIALVLAAKTYAYLQGRAYVTPQDVKNIGYDVLRQRIILSFEAEAEEKTTDDIIKIIFDSIEVP